MSYVFGHAEIAAIQRYWPIILAKAGTANVTPFVLVGLGSRESNWGLGLRPPGAAGTGDFAPRAPRPDLGRVGSRPPDGQGFGRGLLQLDWDAQPFARGANWSDPDANIGEGCAVLMQCRNYFLTHMPSLSGQGLLRASLAAYNHGPGAVFRNIQLNGINAVDTGTTGNNYSMDVLDRASSFENLHVLNAANGAAPPLAQAPLAPPPPADFFEEIPHQAGIGGLDWPLDA